MNILLLFFAIPIALIIFSVALQKIFNNPILVAAIIFAIFLLITFIIGDLTLLIATIIYTILAFVTAVIVCLICRFCRNLSQRDGESNNNNVCDCIYNNNNDNTVTQSDVNELTQAINNLSNLVTGSNCCRRRLR